MTSRKPLVVYSKRDIGSISVGTPRLVDGTVKITCKGSLCELICVAYHDALTCRGLKKCMSNVGFRLKLTGSHPFTAFDSARTAMLLELLILLRDYPGSVYVLGRISCRLDIDPEGKRAKGG